MKLNDDDPDAKFPFGRFDFLSFRILTSNVKTKRKQNDIIGIRSTVNS